MLIKTALVADNKRGSDLFRLLKECEEVDLVGLGCPGDRVDWLSEKDLKAVFVTTDLDKIIAIRELEVVVEATGRKEIVSYLKQNLKSGVRIEHFSSSTVASAIFNYREEFLESRLVKGELLAVLNAVQDAVEVVDEKGIIKYVNPAFTRVTGIKEKERVNRSIFDVSPHGALAQSLIHQKPVTGYRTYVGGSDADVISNASPIIVDDELTGAVVVFQPVGDILKMMDELKHSNTIIDNLYKQIDQLSGGSLSFDSLIGNSKVFRSAVENSRKVARSDSTVLIAGESGSGKSLFARAIHHSSSRKRKPLIVIDCSAVPDSLQEVELFGCEKGALPGVLRTRLGKLELAQESTLFIKEVNSLNPDMQKQLSAVLEKQHFCRVGGDQAVDLDVRVIASSGYDLLNAYARGQFNEDLYRQLSTDVVNIPPLRKRPEDIPLLADYLVNRLNRKLGKHINEISPGAMQEMTEYEWPGNISELQNVLERAANLADAAVIEHHHLSPYIGRPGAREVASFDEIIPLDKMEQKMLKLALARYGETLEGKKKAARALNISLATLYNKLKKF